MNKSVLGGILAVSLILASILAIYVTFARTNSGYRAKQMQSTMTFLGGRLEALENKRDLLRESAAALEEQAAALEEQAAVLNKRIDMIDAEIGNMREGLAEGRRSARNPLLSLKHFRFTTVSGLAVIACLLLIWFLYSGIRGGTPAEEGPESAGAPPPADAPENLQPGSLREEEFQPVAETGEVSGGTALVDGEESGGGDEKVPEGAEETPDSSRDEG